VDTVPVNSAKNYYCTCIRMSIKINFSPEVEAITPELTYIFQVLAINLNTEFDFQISTEQHHSVGLKNENTIRISRNFSERSLSKDLLGRNGFIECEDGQPDFIGTAFFCITSMQELTDNDPDQLQRFQFKNSYQSKLGNVKQNLVQDCFNQLAIKLKIPPRQAKSTFYLSHDIDSVFGAIKEDGLAVLKKGRFDLFLQLLFRVAVGKPDWINIDQIMKIESEYDCISTFYWIVKKGSIDAIQKNADYDFKSSQIQKIFQDTLRKGFENGLHKSLSKDSFAEEIEKFGTLPLSNRYHYLKFRLPDGYHAIENAGLKLDASLGFSDQWGFRNNYGLPFNPFNFQKREPFTFVEVPLHIMDRTFFNKRMKIMDVKKEIFNFFESNKTNTVISVLWHNNFFTDYKYKGYLSLYKNILAYIKEGNFGTTTQQEMIQKYSISWP
jgi:hypothetical protein